MGPQFGVCCKQMVVSSDLTIVLKTNLIANSEQLNTDNLFTTTTIFPIHKDFKVPQNNDHLSMADTIWRSRENRCTQVRLYMRNPKKHLSVGH